MKIKPNTKKNLLKTLIVVALIIGLFCLYNAATIIYWETKQNFTVEEVRKVSSKIFKENMGFKSSFKIYNWDEKYEEKLLEGYQGLFNLSDELKKNGNIYIANSGGGSWITSHSDPTEIAAAFECILYFNGKTLPGVFIGVANAQSKGAMSSYSNMTFISITECAEMCQQVDITGLNRRKAAKKLAKAWIEKHNYVKR